MTTTLTVEALLDMPEDQFRAIVDREVRGTARDVGPVLRDPRISWRWYFALVQMKKSVESQLGAKRADLAKVRPTIPQYEYEQKLTEFHQWRAGALRFKSGVEERLLEIRSQNSRFRPNGEIIEDQRNWALTANFALVQGIREHQKVMLKDSPDEVSDADLALWELVKNVP